MSVIEEVSKAVIKNLDLILASIASGAGTYIIDRKVRRAKTKQAEGNAVQAMQNVYSLFVNDTEDKFADFNERIKQITVELDNEKRRIELLESEVKNWKGKYDEVLKKYLELKAEVENNRNEANGTKS